VEYTLPHCKRAEQQASVHVEPGGALQQIKLWQSVFLEGLNGGGGGSEDCTGMRGVRGRPVEFFFFFRRREYPWLLTVINYQT
jgi:hypothetical protein